MNIAAPAARFATGTTHSVAGAPFSADVQAALTFITPSDVKPVFHSSAMSGGEPKLFFDTERHRVAIRDLRPFAADLSLDREGFVLRHDQTAVADFHDDQAIEAVYYPEIEALLRRETGATQVIIFDVTRRSDARGGAGNPDGQRGPATRVHVDYTVTSGPRRLRDLVGGAEADRLATAGARIMQINVWRPMRGPVLRSPLAVADASSVRPEELVATDQVFPGRVGEIYHLAHAPTQRWYYAPAITPDEVLLIKGWDSLDDGRARFAPHGAF
ncbi:MAG: CmcJ/NvfI family oxidoreductase, partial [Alphaproteobacteria bacterium]